MSVVWVRVPPRGQGPRDCSYRETHDTQVTDRDNPHQKDEYKEDEREERIGGEIKRE